MAARLPISATSTDALFYPQFWQGVNEWMPVAELTRTTDVL